MTFVFSDPVQGAASANSASLKTNQEAPLCLARYTWMGEGRKGIREGVVTKQETKGALGFGTKTRMSFRHLPAINGVVFGKRIV